MIHGGEHSPILLIPVSAKSGRVTEPMPPAVHPWYVVRPWPWSWPASLTILREYGDRSRRVIMRVIMVCLPTCVPILRWIAYPLSSPGLSVCRGDDCPVSPDNIRLSRNDTWHGVSVRQPRHEYKETDCTVKIKKPGRMNRDRLNQAVAIYLPRFPGTVAASQ